MREDGRDWAEVRCACGAEKWLRVDALPHVRSCGAAGCRAKRAAKVKVDKAFRPRKLRTMDIGTLGKAWDAYQKPNRKESIQSIADDAGVGVQTLLSAFRTIQRCGGWDRYAKLMREN